MTKRIGILLPALFGFLGALPHVLFSLDAGRLAYLEYAWDENTYAHFSLSGEYEMYRVFSAVILKSLHFLCGGNIDLTLILVDIAIPFAVMFLAVRIAMACGFVTLRSIFAASVFLALSTAFLSFGDANFLGDFLRKISPFAIPNVAPSTDGILPNLMITFFPLYRTPEPQASMIVQLGLLLVFFRCGGSFGTKSLALLALLCLLLPFTYVSIGIALLVFMLSYGGLGLVVRRDAGYLKILLLSLLASCYYAALFIFNTGKSDAAGFIFASRLPIISPSVIIGVAGLAYIVWLNRQELKNLLKGCRYVSDRHILAAACLAVPVVTLNEQLLTGVMVQSRNWEFYANYIFTAAGILLLYRDLPKPWEEAAVFKKFSPNILCLLLLLLITATQVKSYGRFAERGIASEAGARLIHQIQSDGTLGDRKILLNTPAMEAGIRNRLGKDAPPFMPGHLSLIAHQAEIAALNKESYAPETMPMRDAGFLLFLYRGFSTAELAAFISKQSAAGLCTPEMQYFFWIKDCWGMLSDFRADNKEKVEKGIPLVVRDYEAFLADETRRKKTGSLMYVTEHEISDAQGFRAGLEKVGFATVGLLHKKSLYAYRLK